MNNNEIQELSRILNNFEYDINRYGLKKEFVDDLIFDLKKEIILLDENFKELKDEIFNEGMYFGSQQTSNSFSDGFDEGYNSAMYDNLVKIKKEFS